MNLIRQASAFTPRGQKVCLAIGMFDGVHLGHQQVLRQTIADATQHDAVAVAVTFDRHPNSVVAPERNPPLIYRLDQKLRALEAAGITTALLIHFDHEFSRQSGADFIRGLARDFGRLHSVSVGSSFAFGHQRSGNVSLLEQLGRELRFSVHGLAAVSLGGKVVSSTRIRDALKGGDLDTASQMLGRVYALNGRVIRGSEQGRRLGFPTANLDTTGLVTPANGVYAALAALEGRSHHAVVNIGVRPTLEESGARRQVEVHLLDFQGDLYGRDLEVSFVAQLREERKFPTLEALSDQIRRDIQAARGHF